MSKFRYLSTKTDRTSKELTLEVYQKIINSDFVKLSCENARKAKMANDEACYEMHKRALPLAMWQGYNGRGVRDKTAQKPTQYFMVDIDHAKYQTADIRNQLFKKIHEEAGSETYSQELIRQTGIRIIRETPSGGTRIIVRATQNFPSVQEHQLWFVEKWGLGEYGDADGVVFDFSRTDFITMAEWHHYFDTAIFTEEIDFAPITRDGAGSKNAVTESDSSTLPEITDAMRDFKFNGKLVREIAEEYVASKGSVPEEGLRHSFYNDLVKNFRNICNNDARIIFAVLPLCNGDPKKRWSQCGSICRNNTTSMIPRDFYKWLRDHGYVNAKNSKGLKEMLEAEPEVQVPLPKLPPVFREFCAICPKDFVYPTIVGLLPVMGTLTSYVRADYIDMVEQSTTFFSCIWAPPGCGKSFAKRLVDVLMRKLKVRDEINNLREQLFLVDTNTKSDNDKGVDLPHVMVRIMPAINSLPEFLEKMRDNQGYHMFTMAEEVDTFKKGSSSGGADKSDLFRTAWDNSEYGQSFKSTATFKGMVKVYYNILLTGTPGAVKRYYSNVEDGMVTRISICEIENQEFAPFQTWKRFTNAQKEVIDKFVERCDENTYKDPLDMDEDPHLYTNSSKNYDENVKWKFNLRDKKHIDMDWLFPVILDWLEEKRIQASVDYNKAADTFRRRTAVKGFRLGMVCTQCWSNVGKKERKVICDFVKWFMDRDLQESLKMFGEKYNKLQESVVETSTHHNSLFTSLSNEFSKNDLIAECIKQGVHSKVRLIICRWKQDKVIQATGKDTYKKIRK